MAHQLCSASNRCIGNGAACALYDCLNDTWGTHCVTLCDSEFVTAGLTFEIVCCKICAQCSRGHPCSGILQKPSTKRELSCLCVCVFFVCVACERVQSAYLKAITQPPERVKIRSQAIECAPVFKRNYELCSRNRNCLDRTLLQGNFVYSDIEIMCHLIGRTFRAKNTWVLAQRNQIPLFVLQPRDFE